MTPTGSRPATVPEPPSRRPEYPLRLAQVLLPPSGNNRQLRGSSGFDPVPVLQPSRWLDLPGSGPAAAPTTTVDDAASPQDGGAAASRSAFAANPLMPPAAASEPAEYTSTTWVIPPIRWGGTIGYSLRQNSSSNGSRGLDQVLNANVRASSYIYAPWLATVSGSLGMITGVNKTSAGGNAYTLQTSNTSLVGSGALDLFPSSRFPFGANLSRSDSRVASVALNNNYTDTRFGLRQSYRSEDSLHNASAGFDHSIVTTQGGATDTVNALYGSYNALIGEVSNSVNARLSVSERSRSGEGSNLFSVNTTHSYSPQENLSLQGFSNFTDNNLRYGVGGSSINQTRGQYLQLGTAVNWRPELEDEEDYPLSINGGLNYYGAKTGANAATTDSQRISGTASAYYRFSPNLSINGAGTVNYFSSSSGSSQVMSLVNSSAVYSGDPLTIGKFSYNWNAGGNMSWQSGAGKSPSSLATGLQAGHSLGRNIIISAMDSMSVTLSQNVTTYQNQAAGNTSNLSHNATASYRTSIGEQFTGSITTTFSDTMTAGLNAQHYQSLNVSTNGLGQLSPRSSATVNLNFNWTDQTVKTTVDSFGQPASTQRMSMAGNASYNHVRFAGVPGLRYTFLFTADTLLRDDRLLGDPNAQAQRYRYSMDNRLDYRIGLLDLRLSANVNETGGKENALLFFQVSRQIGAY